MAGCIPFRIVGSESGPDTILVCMVSSNGGKGWVFPKGGWETDETLEDAARRETVEEAGLRGALEMYVGSFAFKSLKLAGTGTEGLCIAHMYSMNVEEELEEWPEKCERRRAWFHVEEAGANCRHEWMKDALHLLLKNWKRGSTASTSRTN